MSREHNVSPAGAISYAYFGFDRSQIVSASKLAPGKSVASYVDETLDILPELNNYVAGSMEDYAHNLFSAPERQRITALAYTALLARRGDIVQLVDQGSTDYVEQNRITVQACARAAVAAFAAIPWAWQEHLDAENGVRGKRLLTPALLGLDDQESQNAAARRLTDRALTFLDVALKYDTAFMERHAKALRQPSKTILRYTADRLRVACTAADDPQKAIGTLMSTGHLPTRRRASKPYSPSEEQSKKGAVRQKRLAAHNEDLQALLTDEALDPAVLDLEVNGKMLPIRLMEISFVGLGVLIRKYSDMIGRSLYNDHVDPETDYLPSIKDLSGFDLIEPIGRGGNVFVRRAPIELNQHWEGGRNSGRRLLSERAFEPRRYNFVIDRCIRGKPPEPFVYELVVYLSRTEFEQAARNRVNILRFAARPNIAREEELLRELLPLRDATMQTMNAHTTTGVRPTNGNMNPRAGGRA